MPENNKAWAFFQEITFWSGGGFYKDGTFDIGNISDGLRVVLIFRKYQLSEFEIDELYNDLKIIIASINEVNKEKHGH
ncbi:MAG TPA: hypothetical protein VMV56_07580 [Williamwhitmania sp.]|nr:hypothetical protein [Williamwhitmania sp.]